MRFLKYVFVAAVLTVLTQGCAVRTMADRDSNPIQLTERIKAILTDEANGVLQPMRAGIVDKEHYVRLLVFIWHGADVTLLGITEGEIAGYAQKLNTRTDVALFVLRENQGRPEEVVMTHMTDVLDARFGKDNY